MPSLRAAAAGVLSVALATGILFRTAPSVSAGSSCTGWASTVTPPTHINVLRAALARVETVPFRRYVEIVMAAEWGPDNPREALAAGAVAVKQYAWYYAMAGNWRGGSLGGRCFDVRDTTADQVYRPASKSPTQRHLAAVAESWPVTVRKPDRTAGAFFPTQYNNGDGYTRCGTGLTGHTLRQVGASSCAAGGYSFGQILSLYYGPGARLVTSPAAGHDLDGHGRDDIGVLVEREAAGGAERTATDALVLSSNGARVSARADHTLGVSLGSVVDHVTADLTGDRRPDLAVLHTSSNGPEVTVFPAGDADFVPGVTWWQSGGLAPDLANARIELISGRWERGGDGNVGLIAQQRDGGGPVAIYELPEGGDGAQQATLAWEGDPGGTVWAGFGGDVTGDGLDDVTLVVATGAKGSRLLVLAGTGRPGALAAAETWATDADLTPGAAVVLHADVNGDRHPDLVAVERDGDAGLRFVGYRAADGRFDRVELGEAKAGYPWQQVRFGVADLNGDLRDDVYALVPDVDDAQVEAFLSRGGSLVHAAWGSVAEIDLASATTY